MKTFLHERTFRYALIGSVVVPCLARLNLTGTGHVGDLYRYIVPFFVGAMAGFFVGRARASLVKEKERLFRNNSRLEREVRAKEQAIVELAASEVRYREIFNAPGDSLMIFRADNRVMVDANQAMLDMYGYQHEDIHRLDIGVLSCGVSPYTSEGAEKYFAAALEGRPQVFSWQSKRENGEQFWVEISLKQTQIEDDRLVIAILRDISTRKQAEQALAEEKERLTVTLRSIVDGVITTDIHGKIMFINKAAEKLTGWSREECVGSALKEVFHVINGKTRELCEDPVKKVMELGQITDITKRTILVTRDGRERNIADSGAPIRDWQSRIVGVVLIFRDVTNELRMEEELLKVRKLESVGVLAGGIAHDFNNILVAILGNLDLAKEMIGSDNKAYSLLSDAKSASLRATSLTQQLLTFSKGGEPVRKIGPLDQLIINSVNFVLSGSSIRCKYEIPKDLWLVEMDQGQINQVMENLAINARQAMPEGGRLTICCDNISDITSDSHLNLPEGDYVKIKVSDNGIGIPENIIDNIFDPYFSTKQTGSGLGLAVTHSIISKHDGCLLVRSVTGEGTEFTIYLPAQRQTKSIVVKEPDRQPIAGKGRVMIMDDEEVICQVAINMLTYLGYQVIVTRDGVEAVEKYRAMYEGGEVIDLVIVDLTIPGGMGGKEVVGKIIKINPLAKVLVSSGFSNDPVMARYNDYGFVGAITKPFSLNDLSRTIRTALS